MKWRIALRVLYDSKISIKLKRKFYKNDTRFWTIKEKYIHEMNVIEIKNIKMDKWKYKKR